MLETSAGPDTLEQIEALLSRTWLANDHVPGPVRTQVGIAVSEIGANILKHAARGRPVNISVEITVLPDQVWVEFSDEGVPARVDLTAVRMPDGTAERGRGLAIAQAALQKLAYRRNARNHWTLVSHSFK